jgi:hypothetical protein
MVLTTDFQGNPGWFVQNIAGQFLNRAQKAIRNPVEDKTVRGQQHKTIIGTDRVKWANPGIKLLRGKLPFQALQTLIPERFGHPNGLSYIFISGGKRGSKSTRVWISYPQAGTVICSIFQVDIHPSSTYYSRPLANAVKVLQLFDFWVFCYETDISAKYRKTRSSPRFSCPHGNPFWS